MDNKLLSYSKIRRIFYKISALFLLLFIFISCSEFGKSKYDEALLYGKWRSGTLYYKYNSNNTGYTWDTKDDVYENEAQRFTWSLSGSELTQIHKLETGGGEIPKVYKISELTSTKLRYFDDYKSYSFTKIGDLGTGKYDETLLYGKWRSDSLYYRYNSDYTGYTWDEKDEVYEDEAQAFKWSLSGSELTLIYKTETEREKTKKVYTISELSSTVLIFYDDEDKIYSFTKVNIELPNN